MLRNLKLQIIDNYEIIGNDMLGILDLILNLEFKILDKSLKEHKEFIIGLLDKNRDKQF